MDNDITNNTKEELEMKSISINVTSTLYDRLIPDSAILKSSSSSSTSLSKDLILSSNTIKGSLLFQKILKVLFCLLMVAVAGEIVQEINSFLEH